MKPSIRFTDTWNKAERELHPLRTPTAIAQPEAAPQNTAGCFFARCDFWCIGLVAIWQRLGMFNAYGWLPSATTAYSLSFPFADRRDAIMPRVILAMLSTVGDVAAAARKVWPDAVKIYVGLGDRSAPPKKTYRVQALADDDRVLGQLDAPTLNLLKAQLEQRFTKGG